MLPVFVESLGGKFVKSPSFPARPRRGRRAAVAAPRRTVAERNAGTRLDYVRGGGSLLLVAEPAVHEESYA